jgi:hypothetical protein
LNDRMTGNDQHLLAAIELAKRARAIRSARC